TQVMFSSRPLLASSIARLILLASYGSRCPLRLTTVIPTLLPCAPHCPSTRSRRSSFLTPVSRLRSRVRHAFSPRFPDDHPDRRSFLPARSHHYIAGETLALHPTYSGRVIHRCA